MNKTLYNTAMDKVTMSDECLGEILDSIDEVQTIPEMKKSKKVRYIQVLTAAVVFVFGSIAVAAEAGGFEWVKSFFTNEEIIPSVYDMVSEIEDFKFESDVDMTFYPVGTISDPKELCFLLSVDNVPKETNFDNVNISLIKNNDFEWDWGSIETRADYNSDEKLLVCKVYSTNEIFESGEYVQFELSEMSEDDDALGTVSFKLNNIGTSNILKINYNEYTPNDDYNNVFDEIVVTPLSMETYGQKEIFKDIEFGEQPFRIVFNDGKEMSFAPSGGCSLGGRYQHDKRFEEGPINPDNITEIYYKDMLIYHKEEKIIPNVYEMVSEIEDFECDSNFNIKLSPVGLISDDHDFYCILHVDSFPDNLNPDYVAITHIQSDRIINDQMSLSLSPGMEYKAEENNFILRVSSAQDIFKSGEKIEMGFDYFEFHTMSEKDDFKLSNIAKISFTINSDYDRVLKINYKEYMPDFIPERDYDFLIDDLTITPLSMSTNGRSNFYADALLTDDFTLVFSDGSELKNPINQYSSYGDATRDGTGALINIPTQYDTLGQFEEPIDPDSITEIYLGDMLIYRK